jgi:hypothetical protein
MEQDVVYKEKETKLLRKNISKTMLISGKEKRCARVLKLFLKLVL